MFDGATFIGPLMRLTGGDEPPEFYWANYWHDRNYYERPAGLTRAQADRNFYDRMVYASAEVPEPRRTTLLRKARTRYYAVRLAGWFWWAS